jgi:FMN reductase
MTGRRSLAVISGGLRQPSSTRLLADRLTAATVAALEERGLAVDVHVVEPRAHAHDIVNHLLTGFPPGPLKPSIDAVVNADGVIAVTPIFSGSYSGLFKSFVDVLEDGALAGMPVLIGATGGTARHSLALEHAMRPLFAYQRAIVLPTSVYAAPEDWAAGTATPAGGAFDPRAGSSGAGSSGAGSSGADPGGSVAGAPVGALAERIARAGRELAEQVAMRERPPAADPFALSTSFERLLAGD